MGRFYKTSKGNYLDFMYKQPTNLLLKAQQVADQSLAQQQEGYTDLYSKLKMNYLAQDKEQSDKIILAHEQEIEEKTADLRNNPLKYINNPDELTELSKKIYKDKTRGKWAAVEANYNSYQAYKEKLDAMVKGYNLDKGVGISRKEADELLGLSMADFNAKKGTLDEAGELTGVDFSGKMISDAVDPFTKSDEIMSDIKESIIQIYSDINWQETADGKYIVFRRR